VDVDEHTGHVAVLAERHRFPDEGEVFQLVLEQLRRVGRAITQGADILHAVDDPQMSVLAQVAGISGAEPALGSSGARRAFRIAVVFLEQAWRTHEDLALLRELDLYAIGRWAYRVRLDAPIALHRHEEAGLGRAV